MISDEYAAGFFDGEGCVNISVKGKSQQVVLELIIANTDEAILQEFQFTYGGSLREEPVRKPGCKPMWILTYCAREGIDFLRRIHPYLRIKKRQAEVAFEFWEFKRSGNTERLHIAASPASHHLRLRRKPSTVEKELSFKGRMNALNRKGVPNTA